MLVVVLVFAGVAFGQFPCNTQACAQLGQACDQLSQICCDSQLNCVAGVCTGTPSVAGNDQIQQDFSNPNPSLSFTGIFQEASRYLVREAYDAWSFPAGPLEPANRPGIGSNPGGPFRIFLSAVEVGSPLPCCNLTSLCSVGQASFVAGTSTNGYSSNGGCLCDPQFYFSAGCSFTGAAPPAVGNCSFVPPTTAPAVAAALAPLAAAVVLLILLA